jgi:hypothetical protein
MAEITDEFMMAMLPKAKTYTVVLLSAGPNRTMVGADKIVWEHGRRNFSLRADGVLSVVCPVTDASPLAGIGIFNASEEETKAIMDADPGVQAGVFVYELHPCRSFPGDALPA